MWNAWSVAWGDAWGWSWGPLYEVEETKPDRPGGGGTSAAEWRKEVIRLQRIQIQDEDEFIISVIGQMIAVGAIR
jgi:hypothetical protein